MVSQSSLDPLSLLIGLPDGTPQIRYTNMKALRSAVDSRGEEHDRDESQSPFLVVRQVPSTILQGFDRAYPDRGPRIAGDLQAGILVLETLASAPHEIIARSIEFSIETRIVAMGLKHQILDIGSSRFCNRRRNFLKVPDASFKPAMSDWPTVAIEIGLSESPAKLAIDARGWLESDGSKTEIVITAKIDRKSPLIVFHRWERDFQALRPNLQMSGKVVEEVIATRENGLTRVTGDITLPFEKVAGRAARSPREEDIVLSKETIDDICREVWLEQQFINPTSIQP